MTMTELRMLTLKDKLEMTWNLRNKNVSMYYLCLKYLWMSGSKIGTVQTSPVSASISLGKNDNHIIITANTKSAIVSVSKYKP